jgi:hypothetical protein
MAENHNRSNPSVLDFPSAVTGAFSWEASKPRDRCWPWQTAKPAGDLPSRLDYGYWVLDYYLESSR